MKKILQICLLISAVLTQSCSTMKEKKAMTGKTYLALGDSYTIGEGVEVKERWPNQLTERLRSQGIEMQDPLIIGKTGWRVDETLKEAQNEIVATEKYDLVSILIGVNNKYQKKTLESFESDFRKMIDFALLHCKKSKNSLFVVSIPDYGVTPFAGENGESVSKDLKLWNDKIQSVCKELNIDFFNITPLSQKAKNDPTLLVEDGLHPSGKMYTQWVNLFGSSVYKKIGPPQTPQSLKVLSSE